ncbi:DUF1292 domain-containing protein [Cohnella abietis]|uniref:Uncharacterized protein n=1 Tax=Cohnella abietis TaxID=2507935 RepID=A0A3T1DA07_9BACL|nr:DUF1292 domain-containing protein [Cohnella abietis]BBI34818.1 hypothetical protein KCTCHS21_42170 [Cohnella abietis]
MPHNNKAPSELSALRQAFGDQVELHGEDGTAQSYHILSELTVNGRDYVILQSEAMKQDDDFEVFRVIGDTSGDVQLETISDEEEWELVAEAFDDSQFGSDDQP